uniref:Bm460 n=1 Tax=Brugia malayi TaxID=6279 RepID=A0A0J9XV14_BRUMA|nr:Bm460 [Brugia malayi]
MQVIKVDNHILTSKNSMKPKWHSSYSTEGSADVNTNLANQITVEIITDYKIDKLWDDGSLTQTTQVEESMLLNCDRMEDGRVSILEEKPLLFVRNTLNLIK